jgi:hypothetical protein
VEYRLSDHARQEIERRKIPLALVEEILRSPEQTTPERSGRTAYQSRQDIGGKMLLVRAIVDNAFNPAVVVTVYRITKISKCWQTPRP